MSYTGTRRFGLHSRWCLTELSLQFPPRKRGVRREACGGTNNIYEAQCLLPYWHCGDDRTCSFRRISCSRTAKKGVSASLALKPQQVQKGKRRECPACLDCVCRRHAAAVDSDSVEWTMDTSYELFSPNTGCTQIISA